METRGNTFEANEPLLDDLLKQIDKGEIQLPDFQRGWVWDDYRIRALIASVIQGFPMGALMTMETGGEEVRFFARPFEGVKQPDQAPALLMLDGRQRTTSLYLALMSKDPVPTKDAEKKEIKRHYYLDMQACLNGQDQLEAVISIPESRILTSNFGRTVELDLTSRENEFANNLFPLDIALDSQSWVTWLLEYHEHYSDDAQRRSFSKRFIEEIITPLGKYKVPVIKLKKNTPKEAVCQVFENVNTGGVSLTVFELITATFAADNFRLRKDWEDKRKTLRDTDQTLHGVDGTAFLTAITLLASYKRHLENGSAISCKPKDILNLTLKEYLEYADLIIEGMKKAARFLHSQKIYSLSDLPYQTQLIPLSVICALLGDKFDEHPVRQKIRRWYWCGVLGELYGGANETRFTQDVANFMQWLNGGDEPVTIRDANFAPLRLLTLQTRNSAAYKGIYALMMGADCKDFISGDSIDHIRYFEDAIDIHHIFPASYCQQKQYPRQLWNSIVNKAPLAKRTNRILGGKAPSVYIERIIKNDKIEPGSLNQHLQSQLIDPGLLASDNFEAFIAQRARSLLNQIENAMGKSVNGRDSEETIREFGVSLK